MFSPAYPVFDPLCVSWRLPYQLVLEFHRVGGFVAVFNTEADDTHVLAPEAAAFLERLAAGEIIAGSTLDEAADGLERAGFDPSLVLRQLHVLGLAEPYTP